jgi:hypothetical protein
MSVSSTLVDQLADVQVDMSKTQPVLLRPILSVVWVADSPPCVVWSEKAPPPPLPHMRTSPVRIQTQILTIRAVHRPGFLVQPACHQRFFATTCAPQSHSN